MSNQIQFSAFNFNSSAVRVITDSNQEHWFCGKDVCDILGYTNDSKALKDHCKEKGVTKRYSPTQGGKQELTFINEPNLYRLIIKSRKPEAEKFEAWVFEEVLPQIRKTGKYALQKTEQIAPLAEIEQDQEAVQVISRLFNSLNSAYELATEIQRNQPHLARELEKQIGGHFIYNLQGPTRNSLDAARKYIQAKSERIAIVRGMVSLLETLPAKHI